MADADEHNVKNEWKKWEVYGNNYFLLSVNYLGTNYQMDAVLTEVPSISMSTEWENSPAATIGEKLDEYLNNDMLQFMSAKNGVGNGGRMVAMDTMTSRIYKGCDTPSFSLKFRVYPGQKIGPYEMRNAKEWMYLLGLTTPINSECGFSLENFTDQVKGAAEAATRIFSAMAGDDKKTKKEKKDDDDDKEKEKKKKADKELTDKLSKMSPTEAEAYWAGRREDSRMVEVDANGQTKGKSDKHVSQVSEQLQKDEVKVSAAITRQNNLDDTGRANSASHSRTYGSHLFRLKILPFIFKKSLIVYVNSWSVTPSREWNTAVSDHYYYDFTLECSLDQVPSAKSWGKIFGIPEGTAW